MNCLVFNFQDSLRARVSQMADEQLAMQEALHNIAPSHRMAHLLMMTKHAEKLSRLASRLEGDSVQEPDPPEAA